MVGGLDLFQGSVRVVLGVCAGKIAAVKFSIVFLLAMIRQRLAGNLSAGNAAAITDSTPSSTNDAAPTWMPIVRLVVCGSCRKPEAMPAAPINFANSRLESSLIVSRRVSTRERL